MDKSSRAVRARSPELRARAAQVAAAVLIAMSAVMPVRAQDAASVTLDQSQNVEPKSQVDSDCDRGKWGHEREINGHRFLSPAFVESALVVSYIGMSSSGEAEETPSVPLENLGDIDVHQARIVENIDLQVRVLKRIGLQLNLEGLATSATTSRSLIARGGDYRFGGDFGVLVEVYRLPKLGTQFSLHGTIGTDQGKNLTLLPLIDALDNAPIRTASEVLRGNLSRLLLAPYSNVRWSLAANIAQPFGRAFGAQASLGVLIENIDYDTYNVEVREPAKLELSRVTPAVGLALTGDAIAVGVPLALMLEYRLSLPDTTNKNTDQSNSTTEHVLAAGLYYSGRADLQTGLVVYGRFGSSPILGRDSEGDPAPSGKPTLVGARYMLRYFW